MRIVIVGNGVAGMEAALHLAARDEDHDLTIVSEESDHFFSRTALMWVHCGQLNHRDIEPLERDAYARLGIRRVRARATGVDPGRRRLHLAGGLDPLPYDRLLIACGSRPRPAPWSGAELRGVGHFVTLQDLAWYEEEVYGKPMPGPPRPHAHLEASAEGSPYAMHPSAALHRGRPARSVAVIGGGLVGIEAVEVAMVHGVETHFFVREEWFWPMALDRAESAWIAERLREHAVHVHLEHEVEALVGDGDGNLSAVRTNHGEHACDAVVVAIGVIPNTDWLEGSPIERDRGGAIVVDEGLRTSAPDVFAAGDCAGVRWFDGTRRPEQLWYTARDQGRVAARAMAGEDARYDRGLWYNSAKLADIEYTTAGLVGMDLPGEHTWFFEEKGPVRSTTRIVTVDDRVRGFNLLGRRWDHSVLLQWIRERRTLRWVLDHLHKASFDTEMVPPLKIPQSAKETPPCATGPDAASAASTPRGRTTPVPEPA
jgi:NADPH-dependent 2,4-dienoyl-CoA reductase/sulfur reductase-like enzyme